MIKEAVRACVVILVLEICAIPAHANSYLDMITEPPEGDVQEENVFNDVQVNTNSQAGAINWWYDSRIKTRSPVVVSPYPKYYAWLRAKANEHRYDDTDEQIQNLIYAVEGGLVGWGLYEIYRYKHK